MHANLILFFARYYCIGFRTVRIIRSNNASSFNNATRSVSTATVEFFLPWLKTILIPVWQFPALLRPFAFISSRNLL